MTATSISLAGYNSGGAPVTEVWRNNGGGSFSQASTAPTDVVYGSVAWGDYDNDGDLDILLAGENSSGTSVTEVWRNEDCPLDLSIVKTVTPSTAAPGGTITYTLTFSNAGGVTATGVVITDSIPVSVTSPTVVGSSGAAITLTGSAPHFVWSVANLAPGQGGVITLTGVLSEPLAAGVFTNTAEIACAETEGDETNNSSDAALTVQNVAPVADAGNNQTVLISTTVTLDGSASSDANGDALTYDWAQTGGPSVTLSDASAESPTFTAPGSATVLTFTLTVTDSHGLADPTPDEVVVTVSANLAPIADAGDDQAVSTGDTVTLDGSASSDPNGDALTYGWAQTGGTTVGLSDATAESPTFTAPSATGLLTFTLTVTDALGLADATPDEVAVNVVSGGTSTPVEPATGGSLVYTTTQTGGTVSTTIDIPPGAVTDTISLIYTEIPSTTNDAPDGFSFAGRTFTLDAYLGTVLQAGYVFNTPITLTLDYDPDALGDVDEATLELHYWDGSQWTSDGIVVIKRDTTNHRLVVTIAHLTEFAMLGTEGGQHTIYLPLAFRNYVVAPDLVVQSVTATSDDVQVVIENQGNAPVTDEFWVEVYINPNPAPTAVNQLWYDLGNQGMIWGVTSAALPLAPGGTITLTIGDAYYWPSLSRFYAPLAAGTPVYAQVDAWNEATTYGAVLESHEITGGTYNNVGGPFYSTAYTFSNTTRRSWASTRTVSPSANSPPSSANASGSCTSRWMTRLSGRAP